MENVLVLTHEQFEALKWLKNDLSLVLCSKDGYICSRYVEVVDILTGELL